MCVLRAQRVDAGCSTGDAVILGRWRRCPGGASAIWPAAAASTRRRCGCEKAVLGSRYPSRRPRSSPRCASASQGCTACARQAGGSAAEPRARGRVRAARAWAGRFRLLSAKALLPRVRAAVVRTAELRSSLLTSTGRADRGTRRPRFGSSVVRSCGASGRSSSMPRRRGVPDRLGATRSQTPTWASSRRSPPGHRASRPHSPKPRSLDPRRKSPRSSERPATTTTTTGRAREPGPSRRETSDSPTLSPAGVYTPRRRLRL